MKKTTLPNHPIQKPEKKDLAELPNFPIQKPGEDIFNQWRKVRETGYDDTPEIDLPLQKGSIKRQNVPDFSDGVGGQLDVPGSELDDVAEKIGSEDEENNFYSLPD